MKVSTTHVPQREIHRTKSESRTAMTINRQMYNSFSKILVPFILTLIASASSTAQVWTVIGAKPNGTERDPALAAAAQLSYRYDKLEDFLWFRVSLYGVPNEKAFGVNLVFNTG